MFHFWVYFIHNEYDDDDDDDKGEDDDEVTSPRFNGRFELPGFFQFCLTDFLWNMDGFCMFLLYPKRTVGLSSWWITQP